MSQDQPSLIPAAYHRLSFTRPQSHSRRRSLSDGDLQGLQMKNNNLARDNAILRQRCRNQEMKIAEMERSAPPYANKVKALAECYAPFVQMLEECKEKLNYVQQMVEQRLADALNDETHVGPDSSSDTCRFNAVDQERHRIEACERLKHLANEWNLSTIAETSRSRISTISLTGRISVAQSALNPIPDGSDGPEDVFESTTAPFAGPRLFNPLAVPRMTYSRTESDSSSCQTESNAAGDQLSSTPTSKSVETSRCPPSDELAVTSTVPDVVESSISPASEPVVKPKRKPAVRKAKAPAKEPVIKVKAPPKPRTKKKALEEAVPSVDGNEQPGSSEAKKSCAESETPLKISLRPRRKVANYRE